MSAVGRAIGVTALVLLALVSALIVCGAIIILGLSYGYGAVDGPSYPQWWGLVTLICLSAIAPVVSLFSRNLTWRARLSIAVLPPVLAWVMLDAGAAFVR